ncbi:hypothetical protein AS29_014160 [Bacillus sp. SJS]|nr:hypothetical protein AS29_014160 [Bacillus sp. SJS]
MLPPGGLISRWLFAGFDEFLVVFFEWLDEHGLEFGFGDEGVGGAADIAFVGAPYVFAWVMDDAGFDRVHMDIAANLPKLLITHNFRCSEAVLE